MDPESSKHVPLVVEFAVNFNNHEDVLKIDETLRKKGFRLLTSDLAEKTIQVQSDGDNHLLDASRSKRPDSLDVQSLQKYIEERTGFLAVIKGMGHLKSAVTELRPSQAVIKQQQEHQQEQQQQSSSPSGCGLFGVLRLSQVTDNVCVADGLIDGGQINSKFWQERRGAGRHRLLVAIHEFGDLSSDNYDSIGEPIVNIMEQELGDFGSNASPSSSQVSISIRKTISDCQVSRVIGKSLALSLFALDEKYGCDTGACKREILSAGVIARASTIEANKKQVCTCSGKTLWQERAERTE